MSDHEYATARVFGKKTGGDGEGFLEKVGDFVHDVGSALKGAVHFGKPDADVKQIHIPHLSTTDAKVIVDVLITNPNPVPIPLVDIDYLIEANGNKLVSGLIPDAGTIHAHGSELITIPVNLNFKEITETFEDINPGQIIKYVLKVTLIIDIPILGRIQIPLKKDGEIPIPQKPDVDLERVKLDHLDMKETKATLHLAVKNFNPFDVELRTLNAAISFGGVSVGTANYSDGKAVITKKVVSRDIGGADEPGVGKLQVPITFRPKDFGSALWTIIRGRSTGYALKGNAEVDTPFGPIQLPFNKEGGQTKFKSAEDRDFDVDND